MYCNLPIDRIPAARSKDAKWKSGHMQGAVSFEVGGCGSPDSDRNQNSHARTKRLVRRAASLWFGPTADFYFSVYRVRWGADV